MSTHQIPQSELPQNGHSKKFTIDETSILVVCVEDEYFVVSPECTHWNGPLEDGLIKGHSVMCPWHHACFDLRNGKPLEPPALNGLQSHPSHLEEGALVVELDPAEAKPHKVRVEKDLSIVIVGGGAAGQAAAEELRIQGFDGQITILSEAAAVPVDRPNLSKDYLAGHADPDWIPLRSLDWYENNAIEIRLNTSVTEVNTDQSRIKLSNGETLNYHKLLLATGAAPRQTDAPGHDLEGIFTLREWKDADAIIEAAAKARKAVVLGSSFIGMEVAASLAGGHHLEVSVVSRDIVPFERTLGKEIGQMLQREHETHNVPFFLEDDLLEFVGSEGRLTGVRLKSGEKIAADMAIIGIGVQPNTGFLQECGLELGKDGSVITNEFLQSSHPDVFAAGDIARWTLSNGESQRIEHWRTALQQGQTAARNMLGQSCDVNNHIPFFWTTQWDISLGYVGHAASWDDILYRQGRPGDESFIAYYIKDGELQAGAAVNRDEDLLVLEYVMQQGKAPNAAQILADEQFDVVAFGQGK